METKKVELIKGYICFTPIIIFLLYILIYSASYFGLTFSKAAIPNFVRVGDVNFVQESIFRSGWGMALIIANVLNLILLAFCFITLLSIESVFTRKKESLFLFIAVSILIWLLISCNNLGGGVAELIYNHIAESQIGSVIHFRSVINVTTANGFLAIFFLSLLLSSLCSKIKESNLKEIKVYLKVYKFLLFLTAVYLSASLLQIFLQYQWFSVFLPDTPNLKLISFGYPFIISVFYVGIFCALFLPAAEIMKNLTLLKTDNANQKSFDESMNELFPKYAGLESVFNNFKSFLLFVSPILTVVIAETAKILNFS